MKKNRHIDEQIVKILREADQSLIAETAWPHSLTEQTIYRKRFQISVIDPIALSREDVFTIDESTSICQQVRARGNGTRSGKSMFRSITIAA